MKLPIFQDHTPTITIIITAVTIAISLLAWKKKDLLNRLLFCPYDVMQHHQWYRIFSYGLVHVSKMHLLANMITLFCFGAEIEESCMKSWGLPTGHLLFGLIYFSALAASCSFDLVKHRKQNKYCVVGASGAVAAIMMAYIWLNPSKQIYVLSLFPIPGCLFAFVYFGFTIYMAKKKSDKLGHSIHLAGAVWGLLMAILFLK